MCCRYWTDESPELRPIVEEMNRSPLMRKWQDKAKVKSYGEIFPTDVVPVIAPNRSGLRTVYPMKWGYSGKSLLMNARSETAAEKPTCVRAGFPNALPRLILQISLRECQMQRRPEGRRL